MRLPITLAVVLAGAGCQTLSPPTHKSTAPACPSLPPCACAKPPVPPAPTPPVISPPPPPPLTSAARVKSNGVLPASTARTTVTHTETTILQSAPGDITQVSCAAQARAAASAPPGMVAGRVQTTTTYKHHCNLGLDYLQIHLPFPHLRIFTGPDQVVSQTEFVPAQQPAPTTCPLCETLLPPLRR